jgi:hypothetical protein
MLPVRARPRFERDAFERDTEVNYLRHVDVTFEE